MTVCFAARGLLWLVGFRPDLTLMPGFLAFAGFFASFAFNLAFVFRVFISATSASQSMLGSAVCFAAVQHW